MIFLQATQISWKVVRKSPGVVVFAEHPDYIAPRQLTESLTAQFGQDNFKISLRKNIYVIYVDRRVVSDEEFVSCGSFLPLRPQPQNKNEQFTNENHNRCQEDSDVAEINDIEPSRDNQGPVAKTTVALEQSLHDIKIAEKILKNARIKSLTQS